MIDSMHTTKVLGYLFFIAFSSLWTGLSVYFAITGDASLAAVFASGIVLNLGAAAFLLNMIKGN